MAAEGLRQSSNVIASGNMQQPGVFESLARCWVQPVIRAGKRTTTCTCASTASLLICLGAYTLLKHACQDNSTQSSTTMIALFMCKASYTLTNQNFQN